MASQKISTSTLTSYPKAKKKLDKIRQMEYNKLIKNKEETKMKKEFAERVLQEPTVATKKYLYSGFGIYKKWGKIKRLPIEWAGTGYAMENWAWETVCKWGDLNHMPEEIEKEMMKRDGFK